MATENVALPDPHWWSGSSRVNNIKLATMDIAAEYIEQNKFRHLAKRMSPWCELVDMFH